jgi:hypothetical protein
VLDQPDSQDKTFPQVTNQLLSPTVPGPAGAGVASVTDSKSWTVYAPPPQNAPSWYPCLATPGPVTLTETGQVSYGAVPSGETCYFYAKWTQEIAFEVWEEFDSNNLLIETDRRNNGFGSWSFGGFTCLIQ